MPDHARRRPATAAARKAAQRAQLRARRAGVTADPTERRARSARIWAGLVPYLDPGGERPTDATGAVRVRRVMLFEGLPTEPDTAAWLEWCRSRGLEVFVPQVAGADLRVVPGDVDPATLDVVVVPGVGFTPAGDRLGQGGGHYDRFLRRLRPGCVTIGVCFAEQLVAELPVEPHDVRVGVVVTDAPRGGAV